MKACTLGWWAAGGAALGEEMVGEVNYLPTCLGIFFLRL